MAFLSGGVNLVGRAAKSGARVSGSAVETGVRSASDTMARRAARDEIDVTIKEDPLRVHLHGRERSCRDGPVEGNL